jgi:biopolymer transport protein ExbD
MTGCAQADYEYKLENNILECFYKQHQERNIDIKTTINKIEELLIKHNILQDNSGRSYIHVIEQIRDNNNCEIGNPQLLADLNLIGYIPSGIICQDSSFISSIDSTDLANSKLKYVFGIYDSIQVKGDISPKLIAEEILEVFNNKDFENDYYKTLGILMLTNLIKLNDLETGLNRKLPTVEEELTPTENKNILVIYVNKENKIIANGEIVDISNLKMVTLNFLLEKSDKTEIDLPLIGKQSSSNGIISIKNDRETSYKTYLSVQNELMQAYDEIRNNRSKEFFNLPFKKLDEEKQKVIKDLVPIRISEAEPNI